MKPSRKHAPLIASNSGRVVLLVVMLSLAGCAFLGVDAPDGPAQVAQSYVGQRLVDLESQLGPPEREQVTTDYTLSTWQFDRCSVTARTNSDGIIADVSWSRGCAPL